MRNASLIKAIVVPVLALTGTVSAADKPGGKSTEPIGRVTASFGNAKADTAAGARSVDLQSLIYNDERITTDNGGLTMLLASRVVVKVDANSAFSVLESPAQTTIRVEKGSIQVFVGQRPTTAGPVCVGDPNGCIETTEGVFLAHYDPSTKQSYFACEHSTISVEVGEHTADHQHVVKLDADQQMILDQGKLVSTGALDRNLFNERLRSLNRLEQAQNSQGSQTFRLRSRELDTESAISQLSAAGWIDAKALPAARRAAAAQAAKSNNNSTASKNGTANAPSAQTASASIKPAAAAATSTPPVETSSTSSTPQVAKTEPSLSPSTPAPAPVAVDLGSTIQQNTPAHPSPSVAPIAAVEPVKLEPKIDLVQAPPKAVVVPVEPTPHAPAIAVDLGLTSITKAIEVTPAPVQLAPISTPAALPATPVVIDVPVVVPVQVTPKIDLDLGIVSITKEASPAPILTPIAAPVVVPSIAIAPVVVPIIPVAPPVVVPKIDLDLAVPKIIPEIAPLIELPIVAPAPIINVAPIVPVVPVIPAAPTIAPAPVAIPVAPVVPVIEPVIAPIPAAPVIVPLPAAPVVIAPPPIALPTPVDLGVTGIVKDIVSTPIVTPPTKVTEAPAPAPPVVVPPVVVPVVAPPVVVPLPVVAPILSPILATPPPNP